MSRATWLCPNRTEASRVTKAAMPFTLHVPMPVGSFRPRQRAGQDFFVGWFKPYIAGPFKGKPGTSGG